MTHHVHLVPRRKVLAWHRHPGATVKHQVDADQAHPQGEPRRDTLRTWDGKPVES